MKANIRIIAQTYVRNKLGRKFNVGREVNHQEMPCQTVRLAACEAKAAKERTGCGRSGSDATSPERNFAS